MPKGIYVHGKYTQERRDNISKALMGKKKSAEACEHMKGMRKERNANWKGDNAKKITIHEWVARYKPKQKKCEYCDKEKKLCLANMKNHQYTRELNDYKWLCYSCHEIMDHGWIHKREFNLFKEKLKEWRNNANSNDAQALMMWLSLFLEDKTAQEQKA